MYDINGGTWVYEDRGQNQFRQTTGRARGTGGAARRRSRAASTEGITIVTAGAAELYGTEFYVSK